MTITNKYVWTGKLSTEWTDNNGTLSNWNLTNGSNNPPSSPSGPGDQATFDSGDDITVTADSFSPIAIGKSLSNRTSAPGITASSLRRRSHFHPARSKCAARSTARRSHSRPT